MLLRNEQQAALNEIESLCIETADHYLTAAGNTEDASLAGLFSELAQQRRQFAAELADHIRALDDLPQQPDPDRETMEDVLTSIKGFFSGHQRETLIEDRKKQEQQLTAAVQAGLRQPLPAETKIVLRQLLDHAALAIRQLEQTQY